MQHTERSVRARLDRLFFWVLPWLAPVIATVIAGALSHMLPRANFAMIYLAGVLLTATTTGLRPALLCAVLSFLAYNFFYTQPHFTLLMVEQEDILTLGLFILVATATGHLAARLREKVIALENSHRTLRQETLIKEREQLRSALLASISHDLRTPLATMIGSVSSVLELRDALTPEEQDELLTNTLSEAQRLDRYIQNLLDMTRLGHGELPLDRAWLGVDDLLSVVLKRARPLAEKVHLKANIEPDLPLLHVHPALIEQALFNVLENAIRFAPADSSITLSASVVGQQVHIDVTDHGPGIAREDWDSIFDMFVSITHGDQSPSTGLGLAICKGIMGAHGGEVRVVESLPYQRTTIRLSLPLPEHQTHPGEHADDQHPDH